MSQAIIQSMNKHEPNAFSNAKKWMLHCKHDTPEVWVSYSKLMAAYLEQLSHYGQDTLPSDNAWPIVRYYALALDKLQNAPWHPNAFLLLHDTTELWHQIPADIWLELQREQWNPTVLYQWSLDNEKIQQDALNTRAPGNYHAEPLHVRMGAGILEQCFKGLPILLDPSVHWDLWRVFYGEQIFQTSPDLTKRIGMLALATPASFEHAITEFYQSAPHLWTQPSCAHILKMNMALGHPLTTCSGVLLLYFRFKSKGRVVFASIEKRYPKLLAGFDMHLALYPDVNDALFYAPALMGYWMHAVHGQDNEGIIPLPADVEIGS